MDENKKENTAPQGGGDLSALALGGLFANIGKERTRPERTKEERDADRAAMLRALEIMLEDNDD